MRKLTLSVLFLILFSMLLAGPLSAQTIVVNPDPINFTVPAGASATVPITVTVTPATSWTISTFTGLPSLLSVVKISDTQATVTLNSTGVDPTSPPTAYVVITAGSATKFVTVNVTITNVAGSQINASASSLTFSYQQGSGGAVAPQYLTVTSTSASIISYSVSATSAQGWLSATPTGGNTTTANIVTVQVNPGTLAVGGYDGIITLTPTNVLNPVPIQVAVRLNITGSPQLTLDKTSLSFPWQVGTAAPASQLIHVTVSNSTQQVPVFASVDAANSDLGGSWLVVSSGSGTFTPTDIQVSISSGILTSLTPRKYNGRILITAPSLSATPISVPVTLTVSQLPLALVTPASLQFSMAASGTLPAAQSITVDSTSTQLAYTAAFTSSNGTWATLNPVTGLTRSSVQVSLNGLAQTLPAGTYTGTITVTPNNGSDAQTVAVTLTVLNTAVLTTTPGSMNFVYQIGKFVPGNQPLAISSSGATQTFTAAATTASGGNWLILYSAGGGVLSPTDQLTSGTTIAVGVNVTGLLPGTYTGNINLTPTNASSPAIQVPVTFQVSNNPLLLLSPVEINVTFLPGGATTNVQTIAVNSTSDPITFNVSFSTTTGLNWLLASATGGSMGSTPSNVTVYINAGGLPSGIYTGSVTIAPTNGSPAQTVPVKVTVSAGSLSVSPTTLTFSQTAGGTVPAAQQLSITNGAAGGSPLPFSATVAAGAPGGWLIIDKTSGTTPSSINVSMNSVGLAAGTYTGSITITSPGASGSPQTVGVTLNVSQAQTITLSASGLNFNGSVAQPPAAQSVTLSTTGPAINFTTSTSTNGPVGVSWLAVTPTSGSVSSASAQALSVSIVPTELAKLNPGTYTGSVMVTAPGAANSPQTIQVVLTVPSLTIIVPTTPLTFTGSASQTPAAQTVTIQGSTVGMTFKALPSTTSGGNWLAVVPTDGTLPITLSVSIVQSVLATLAPGTYSGTITVTAANTTNSPQVIPVTLNVTSVAPVVTGIVNAGSYLSTPISGGEILYISGTNMGPVNIAIATPTPAFPTFLSDVRVLFDGVPAPIIYVQASQISVVAPWFINAQASTRVQVEYKGQRSDPKDLRVASVAPGIFSSDSSGTGQGAILNEDNSYNGTGTGQRAVAKNSVIQVFGTGGGVTNPAGIDGALAPPILAPIQASATALVGGIPATVTYAGAAPGLISGLLQVNVQIPAGAPSGPKVPLVILIGGTPTQAGITVAIQ